MPRWQLRSIFVVGAMLNLTENLKDALAHLGENPTEEIVTDDPMRQPMSQGPIDAHR